MERRYRLKNARSFTYIYNHGDSTRGSSIVLMTVPTRYDMKIGLSVSKKIGKAVIRNRTKRLLRENITKLLPYMDHRTNYVIVARSSIVGKSLTEIGADLKSALVRAGKLPSEI